VVGSNETIALVPTMGALHEGHLSLVKRAKESADRCIVSIFVNPMQFGPNEDFANYPRTFKEDLKKLKALGVDAVFLPNAASIYPDGFQTKVHNEIMSQGLCGATRLTHFDGVLTIVLKFFNLVQPHSAVFGKKDYQQLKVITQMVEDLNVPVEVIGCETMREEDGLAMSSRNQFLSDTQRPVAARIYMAMKAGEEVFQSGKHEVEPILDAFDQVIKENPEIELEYCEIRSRKHLNRMTDSIEEPAVMLVAARLGSTRLIDNLELESL
jgi:pantoate--beta-alanine ligase